MLIECKKPPSILENKTPAPDVDTLISILPQVDFGGRIEEQNLKC
jgi:hypothetical protein